MEKEAVIPSLEERLDSPGSSGFGEVARRGVLVLGMHRSGTSAMAGMLGKLGCTLPSDLMGPGIGNEKGHWESLGVVALNDRILSDSGSSWEDWARLDPHLRDSPLHPSYVEAARAALRMSFGRASLFVLKDPRICRLLPLWLQAFEVEEAYPEIVLCVRRPTEVATSLGTRDGMEPGYSNLLWLRHMLEAESQTRGLRRTICHFDQLRQDWMALATRIGAELSIDWPSFSPETRGAIEAFLSPEPPSSKSQDAGADRFRLPWAEQVHAILQRWTEQAENIEDYIELDRIRRNFDIAADGLSDLFPQGSRSLGAGGGHATRTALAQAEAQLAKEREQAGKAIIEANDRLEAALTERDEARNLFARSEAGAMILQSEIGALRLRSEEATLVEGRFAEAKLEISGLQDRLREERTSSSATASALQKALDERAAQTSYLQSELDALRQQVAERQAQWKHDYAQVIRRADEQRAQLESRICDRERLVDQTCRERDDALQRVAQLRDQIEADHASSVSAASQAQKDITDRDCRISDLQSKLSASEVDLAGQRQASADLSRRLAECCEAVSFAARRENWLVQMTLFMLHRPRWWSLMPKAWSLRRERSLLKRHGLFDAQAYWDRYPDVAEEGVDPVRHYLTHGMQEGRKPTH